MSKVKHTQGPWQSMAKDGKYAVETVENYGDEDSDRTALVADCDISGMIHAREKEANCRLISASPELLAALEELLPYARKYLLEMNEKMVGGLYPAINLAKIERGEEAIKKAKGE